ncbi:carbohydrate ABC transporter substrate-binding protein [Duganella dendranthematis]|jgi:raffinose/stachyose/melibiose transport system substrate-binding protein|uniref:Probable sugar-binding periplasmic protein n=1 Tax=Duganella dendranthematis TaxID=2728021 RepID=A0ABX6M4N1_9BURK|nr:ABC transporter substrate-binding protein [Duganella dendranthematis]QJD88921.1 carbohydrate ABC transporter substrate-binding protein [Duganella dendranthematis]
MRIIDLLRRGVLLALCAAASARGGTLVIESWRGDDKTLWDQVLIPAFERHHPGIEVRFAASPPTGYDASVASRLASGGAGDLIACRPFDASLSLYKKGYLDRLNGKPGMQNFAPTALLAWQTDDGKDTFCMPVASVIHGFLYNKKIFRKLDLQPPKTVDEFFAVLDVLKKSGVAPLALGTAEQWESSQMVFTNIGPNFWRGEEGRKALIAGRARFTDAPFVDALQFEARMGSYLPASSTTQSYGDSQAQFAAGRAAIYPAGSWDIAYFSQVPGLEFGAFAPPVRKRGDACFISDHMDIGLGVARNSKNKEDAYKFLAWVGSQEFADLYTDRLTGVFTLSDHLIAVRNPVAKQMKEWRNSCASTIRLNAQVLNRGQPGMESELWDVNARVLNGSLAPQEAADRLQQGFAKWYKPQQK